MSEEILRALMQLFAIITKQDDGASEDERGFVEHFLRQQLSSEVVKDYIALYDSFITGDQDEKAARIVLAALDLLRLQRLVAKVVDGRLGEPFLPPF